MKIRPIICAILLLVAIDMNAQLRLADVFTSNMVLQRRKPVSVWGEAAPGSTVTVTFGGQSVRTSASAGGSWTVTLREMEASAVPQKMTVRSKGEKLVLDDILVGEVWLASGQSNMEFNMGPLWEKGTWKAMAPASGPNVQQQMLDRIEEADKSGKGSAEPLVRLLRIKKILDREKLPTDGWSKVDSVSIRYFSATAFFFAKNIADSLNVPVGVICSSWGGSPIQDWMVGGNRYTCMIEPMAPFAMRGILWYQGETNLINGETSIYERLQQDLVKGWRDAWNDSSLSFYYVQIAPHTYSRRKNNKVANAYDALPEFWTVQEKLMGSVSNSGMVVITDLVDDFDDIHPTYKWEVGRRLSLWALNRNYGRADVVCQSPQVKSVSLEDGKVRVTFDCHGSSLATRDGKAPDSFLLWNGKDKWVTAQARIEGDAVIVWSPSVRQPSALRFAWDELAQPNLTNASGLPVSSFKVEF